MALGNRIKIRRKELGWSQQDLVKATGLSQSTISSIELNDAKKSDHEDLIAKTLKVTTEWLKTGKGQKEILSVETNQVREAGAKYSRDEELLIEKYRLLSPEDRTRLQAISDSLTAIVDKKAK